MPSSCCGHEGDTPIRESLQPVPVPLPYQVLQALPHAAALHPHHAHRVPAELRR
ncbi:MAG: hypothetical protein IPI29_09225 [Ignavibacteria bacterium]|nr:hypothetical protein [Ignavibacteria bacterium]